jgi:AGCS family alanine or glycine:cation symporter
MVGSITQLAIVWTFAMIMNAFMALPNLISLILLSNVLVRETKKQKVLK